MTSRAKIAITGAILAAATGVEATPIDIEYISSSPYYTEVRDYSLKTSTSDFSVTATAHIAEISDISDEVHGPMEATDVRSGGSSGSGMNLYNLGIGVLAGDTATVDLSGEDLGGARWAPGLNGGYYTYDTGLPSGFMTTQFVVFSFDSAVDIGSVVVDDVVNSPRHAWFAYGSNGVDFSGGLAAGLDALTLVNSTDDAGDGWYGHELGISGVTTLVVGSPFSRGSYAGITGDQRSQFYIRGFGDIALSDNPPVDVPTPGTFWLLVTGFAGLFLRGRNSAQE